MARTKKPRQSYDWSWKAATHNGIATRVLDRGERYYDGHVETPYGYVIVYSQGHDGTNTPASSYCIVVDGRCYYKNENVARSKRGLVIMASRFAKEIADA